MKGQIQQVPDLAQSAESPTVLFAAGVRAELNNREGAPPKPGVYNNNKNWGVRQRTLAHYHDTMR